MDKDNQVLWIALLIFSTVALMMLVALVVRQDQIEETNTTKGQQQEREWIEFVRVKVIPGDEPRTLNILETIEIEVQGEQLKGGFLRLLPTKIHTPVSILKFGVRVDSVSRFSGKCSEIDKAHGETYPSESPYRTESDQGTILQLGHREEGRELPLGRNCFILSYQALSPFENNDHMTLFTWPVNFSTNLTTKRTSLSFYFPKLVGKSYESLGLKTSAVIRTQREEAGQVALRMEKASSAKWAINKQAPDQQTPMLQFRNQTHLEPGDIFAIQISIPKESFRQAIGWDVQQ